MQVKLNKESWHCRYYKYASGNNYLPSSLCPYFWGLVFFIVASPVILITRALVEAQEKKLRESSEEYDRNFKNMSLEEWREYQAQRYQEREDREAKRIFWGKVLFWTIIVSGTLTIGWSLVIYAKKIGWLKALAVVAISALVVAAMAFVSWVVIEKSGSLGRWIKGTSLYNLVGGMVYSFYKRACPIINWQDAKTV